MTNNDIFRQLRYIFSLNEADIVSMYKDVEENINTQTVTRYLQKEDRDTFLEMSDKKLAHFLNALIIKFRGKNDKKPLVAEEKLNNNIILRKLKIALNLKDVDMIDIFNLADFKVSKHEISALFRNPNQTQYRACKNQFIRNFLYGLKLKYKRD